MNAGFDTPTTRCYARSMHHAGGCFTQDPEYACAIEQHDVSGSLNWLWLDLGCAVTLVGAVAAVVLGWL